MTITLLENVSAGQGLVAVANPTEATLDDVLQVGTEYVIVRGVPHAGGKLVLGRGVLGSDRASHLAGATLTPVQLVVQTAAPTAPPPTTAGVSLAFRKLSFSVSFDTPDLIGSSFGAELADVPAQSVLSVFIVNESTWDNAVVLTVLAVADGSGVALRSYESSVSVTDPIGAEAAVSSPAQASWFVTTEDCTLNVQAVPYGSDPATGTSSVYAIIATPT